MNDQKIAFIIATNNEQYFSECSYYINRINVPHGFETDVIAVREANSICEAYNAAMNSSDARYKVYLHHDVFILNKDFIQDVLDAFALDASVGMLGVIGATNLPPDAYAFNSWDTGGTLLFNGVNGGISMYSNEEGLNYVSAIDGMMMITNHDLEWREGVFDGWDFYDLSQSMEFWKAGYKIAIPYQKTPWCMHDLAHLGLGKYNHYRRLFCEVYHEDFGFVDGKEHSDPFHEEELKNMEAAHQIAKLIFRDLNHERFAEAGAKLEFVKIFRATQDNDLELVRELLSIYGQEMTEGIRCFWTKGCGIDEIVEKYISLRFLLYRAQFDCDTEDYIPAIRDGFERGILSAAAIRVAVTKYIYDQTKVYRKLIAEGIPAGRQENCEGFSCPICGSKNKVFTALNTDSKLRKQHVFPWGGSVYTGESIKDVYCAGCGASVSERAIAYAVSMIKKGDKLRVALPAYMPVLGSWINLDPDIYELLTSDREYTGQQEEDELQEFLGINDESCDIMIAPEVLNHCADDSYTLRNLYRILKKDGYLIVINSMGLDITDTLEDPSISSEERILHWQIFGGEKNRRSYASCDLINRMIDCGFFVNRVDKKCLGEEVYRMLGLPERFRFYICTKNEACAIGTEERKFIFDVKKNVSVVILPDGHSAKLKKTLEDICSQTYPHIEILITANILTDEEKDVLSAYKNEQVRIMETFKPGKSVRRNIGIVNTDGEYLLFVESGNRFDTNFIYKALKLLEMNENCVFAYADTNLSEDGIGVSCICPDESKSRTETSGDCFNDMLVSAYPNLSSAVIKREAVLQSGSFDEKLGNCGGREFLLRTIKGKEAAEITQILVTVEVNMEEQYTDIEDVINETLEIISEFDLKRINPKLYVRNISAVISEMVGYFGEARERIVKKIYSSIENDGFFDDTDMRSIREELRISEKI